MIDATRQITSERSVELIAFQFSAGLSTRRHEASDDRGEVETCWQRLGNVSGAVSWAKWESESS
jgi:hypothetical protein